MSVYFTKDHEWIKQDGDIAIVGITQNAADQLGEVVFLEANDPGETFNAGEEIGVIESVKAASELYAPVDGEMVAFNDKLGDNPAFLNEDPEAEAWICKIKLTNPAQLNELMDEAAYKAMIA